MQFDIDYTRPCDCWLDVGRCRCQEDNAKFYVYEIPFINQIICDNV